MREKHTMGWLPVCLDPFKTKFMIFIYLETARRDPCLPVKIEPSHVMKLRAEPESFFHWTTLVLPIEWQLENSVLKHVPENLWETFFTFTQKHSFFLLPAWTLIIFIFKLTCISVWVEAAFGNTHTWIWSDCTVLKESGSAWERPSVRVHLAKRKQMGGTYKRGWGL